jgi:hypothetical protein
MTPSQQLAKEAGYDTKVAIVLAVIFVVCGLLLPRSWFWFWFAPMAAFWFRYLWVRCRRDEQLEALLETEVAASGGSGSPRCYRTERGICITDGTHHVLIAGHDADPAIKLPHIVRRQEPGHLTRHALVNHGLTARGTVNQNSTDQTGRTTGYGRANSTGSNTARKM